MKRSVVASALALAIPAALAGAQLTSEDAAMIALLRTPTGALGPIARTDIDPDKASRAEIQLRYGRWRLGDQPGFIYEFDNVGLGGLVRPWKRLWIGGTVGRRTTTGFPSVTMGSLDASYGLFHRAAQGPGGGITDLSVQLSAATASDDSTDLKAQALTALAPLSLTLEEPHGAMVSVFVAPGLYYGYLTDNEGSALGYVGSDGTTRAALAAGAAYVFPFGLAAHATVQRIINNESPTQLGLALSWRPVPRAQR